MLRNKSRISVLRIDQHQELSRRVSEVIGENRRMLLEGKTHEQFAVGDNEKNKTSIVIFVFIFTPKW